MKVYIQPNTEFHYPVRYVLKLIEQQSDDDFHFVEDISKADLIWQPDNESSQPIAEDFYQEFGSEIANMSHQKWFGQKPEILDGEEKKDAIATIYYMVNCLQEMNPSGSDCDDFGRFKYASSFQSRFNCIEENLVQNEVDSFLKEHGIKQKKQRSSFFISHDIDTIYGSFLQDGFWAAKNLQIGTILKIITWQLMRKPHWKNMERITKLNSEYEIRSTFFWLVNKGAGLDGIENADYIINKEQNQLEIVANSGNVNALHKSSSGMTLNEELEAGELSNPFNRYHFLRFNPHTDWQKISDSKIALDCSLGFAEHYGFRNSYGRAYQPFNFKEKKPFDFVEAPLQFMDGTFHKYMNVEKEKVANIIIDYFEKNSENCHFSLLWHNTYFTDFKYGGFLDEYKKVMAYIYENGIETKMPKDLISDGKLEW